MRIAGAAAAALVLIGLWGLWSVWRQPSYLPPRGDEIAILLELAGVFPDNYGIMWREHMALRSTDPEAQMDPLLLDDALFMHRLTTGAEGNVRIEVEYRFFAADHDVASDRKPKCTCITEPAPLSPRCQGVLAFGNYEFTLAATYNGEVCPLNPKRHEEFGHAMQTADRLIGLYLQPLRRKPSWL
jgi:hypothetical protein